MDEKEDSKINREPPSNGHKAYGSNSASIKDQESMAVELPYPKSVFFIVVNEFCERFSYYGMKAVLTLYLANVLAYSDDSATVIYHVFSMFCYFTPLFGAMIADSFLGKFRTILYLSIVYACGNVILALAATTPLGLPPIEFSMIGLGLIAIGTGGIKPCVSAFGGDQFILPQQEKQLSSFFSIFYFSINAGSLISTFITPIFREDVKCFGANDCYPLAFAVPAGLMVTALVIFVIGKPWYRIRKVETADGKGNVLLQVSKCIAHAISRKRESGNRRDHWLDHADDRYDSKLIDDIKVVIKILVLYIPLPVFWALFDQQGSRWTLQATRMDGEIFGYLIKPDQMQVVNPFLILALIPLFDQVLYPALKKCHLLKKPLQRLTFGGFLAGIAFIVSGILELKLEPTYAVKLGATESHLNFVNTLPCDLQFINPELGTHSLAPYQNIIFKTVEARIYEGTIVENSTKEECKNLGSAPFKLEAEAQKAFTYTVIFENGTIALVKDKEPDELQKSRKGSPQLKMILSGLTKEEQLNSTLVLKNSVGIFEYGFNLQLNASKISAVEPGEYQLELVIPANETLNRSSQKLKIEELVHLRLGGNYVLSLTKNDLTGKFKAVVHTITEPNSVHMLWLLPQYIIITIAEVMFSITGLEFSFSQAPANMKSVVQAAWLLTVAFGNLIVVVVAESVKFDKQSKEFFLFAGLMFLDMIVFAVIAYFYKPVQQVDENQSDIPLQLEGKENQGFHKD